MATRQRSLKIMALNATVIPAMPSAASASVIGGDMLNSHSGEHGRPRAIPYEQGHYEMAELLRKCHEHKASDLHLAVGRPPVIRINGSLHDIDGPVLTGQECRRLIYGILNDLQKQKFEENKELDFSLSV